eukprot:3026021-Pleurochrysis_carterae.AAC.4
MDDQKRDPQLRFRESLLATKEEMKTWSKSRMRVAKQHQASHSLEDGIVRNQVVIEVQPLWLADWDGMLTYCEQMCQHCQICRGRDTPSAGGHVATGVTQDPPFPFRTISIDHKTVTAPRSTGYHNILVVVGMLHRFVTAIPTKTMSAEETLTA